MRTHLFWPWIFLLLTEISAFYVYQYNVQFDVGMCCGITSQDRVRVIAIFSILLCIVVTLICCFTWLLEKEDHNLLIGNNSTNISVACSVILQPSKCNLTIPETLGNDTYQNPEEIRVMLTIFQLVIDLPASALLLIGANLRIKQLLAPWMFIMAVKMLGYVIACCIYVQFRLVKMLDEKMGFGMKHYSKLTNDTSQQHYSIFSGSAVDSMGVQLKRSCHSKSWTSC